MAPVFEFGPFELDVEERLLKRGGRTVPLPPKTLETLRVLVSRAGHLVTREELSHALWPDTYVSDATLSQSVWLVRRALGEGPEGESWIETVPRVGYRFLPSVRVKKAGRTLPGRRTSCRLVCGSQRIVLDEGETVVGRDPDLEACFESSSISRRHARLVVNGGVATLEDLGSKNGTWVNGARVSGPVTLSNGDAVRLGSVAFVFRVTVGVASTRTDLPDGKRGE
jgi:DNA-binding winged helix-turn-helix (wHTH) protein